MSPVLLALLGLPAVVVAGIVIGVAARLLQVVDIPGHLSDLAHIVKTRGPIRLEDMQSDIEAASRAWVELVIRMSDNPDDVAKFFSKVRITSGCWYWTGATGNGYGQHRISKERGQAAHRWAYEFVYGEIPEGHQLDHVCHTRDLDCRKGRLCPHRACVNPMHLEPVSPAENRLRGCPARDGQRQADPPLAAPRRDPRPALVPAAS